MIIENKIVSNGSTNISVQEKTFSGLSCLFVEIKNNMSEIDEIPAWGRTTS